MERIDVQLTLLNHLHILDRTSHAYLKFIRTIMDFSHRETRVTMMTNATLMDTVVTTTFVCRILQQLALTAQSIRLISFLEQ